MSSILLVAFIKSILYHGLLLFSSPKFYIYLGDITSEPDKTIHQPVLPFLFTPISFSFWSNFLLIFSNSSFVIQSFFLITLAWSLKHCSVLSVPYHSFQVLCITSYWFNLLVYKVFPKNSIHLYSMSFSMVVSPYCYS